MRRLVWLAVVTLGLSIGACEPGYDNNDLELAVAYRAKAVCSCLWVMERDLDYCMAWTKASPNVAEIDVDYEQHMVFAHGLLLWSARAKWVGERYGCVFVED